MTTSRVLRTAAREIGYKEGKNKNNKYGRWYGMNGVAWCMQFVQWVYNEAGLPLPYETASCGALLRWYWNHQRECITDKPVEGCIVIFDFPHGADTDHTGLFVSRTNTTITTIDGNTSGTNDANGGWVAQKTRPLSYARPTYIIPRGLIKMDIDTMIAEMSDEQAYKLISKAERFMEKLPLPTTWDAKSELAEAVKLGITDGTNPMLFAPRYQTAIMVKRAVTKYNGT